MKFPSKVRTFKESTIYHSLNILEYLENNETKIIELFETLKNKMNIIEYRDALCLLYLIDKIEINFAEGVICYAKNS